MIDFDFYMPHDVVRSIAISSIASYLPDPVALGSVAAALNLERVRYVDGTRNVVGEYPDREEVLSVFRGHVTQTKEQRQARTALDAVAEQRTIFYLFEDVLEGADYGVTLANNDVVRDRATGELYEVTEVHEAQNGAGKAFGRATVVGPKV